MLQSHLNCIPTCHCDEKKSFHPRIDWGESCCQELGDQRNLLEQELNVYWSSENPTFIGARKVCHSFHGSVVFPHRFVQQNTQPDPRVKFDRPVELNRSR